MPGAHLHLAKPRLRGWLHQVAFFVSIPAGIGLVAVADPTRARVGAAVFAVSLTALYGISAAYHRGHWSERTHRVMKHLDHSMIFVFIAGTYTPITLVALRPPWAITLLALAWTGAAAGVALTVLRLERWRGAGFGLYLTLGWLAVFALPELLRALSTPQLALLITGGVLYTTGAIVLARSQPNPHPAIFGYHEIWHTLVTAATSCHFTLILILVRT